MTLNLRNVLIIAGLLIVNVLLSKGVYRFSYNEDRSKLEEFERVNEDYLHHIESLNQHAQKLHDRIMQYDSFLLVEAVNADSLRNSIRFESRIWDSLTMHERGLWAQIYLKGIDDE